MFQGQSQPLKHRNIFTLRHSGLPVKIYCIHQSILVRMNYYLFCNYSQTKCFTCSHTSCPWIFSLFPGHSLLFLPAVLCLAPACCFFEFCNLAASFYTLSSDLFLGLQQAFFLEDFPLEFVMGFCCQTSILHAQPTYSFNTYMLPDHCPHTVFTVLHFTVYSRHH